jgi:hypothetical protein
MSQMNPVHGFHSWYFKTSTECQIWVCMQKAVSRRSLNADGGRHLTGRALSHITSFSPFSVISHILHLNHSLSPTPYNLSSWRRGSAAARLLESRLRFPMVSLEFVSDKQPLTGIEYQEYFLGGKGSRCVGLTTFMCRLSWNLGASTSRNPQGL